MHFAERSLDKRAAWLGPIFHRASRKRHVHHKDYQARPDDILRSEITFARFRLRFAWPWERNDINYYRIICGRGTVVIIEQAIGLKTLLREVSLSGHVKCN